MHEVLAALAYTVTLIRWHLQRTDQLEIVECNVRAKVVQWCTHPASRPGVARIGKLSARLA